MTFGDSVRAGFDNYVNFDGRASKAAFWYWVLFRFIVGLVVGAITFGLDFQILGYLVNLALILPDLTVSVRRLHDTGRTGWWILIGIIPVIGWIVLIIFWLEGSDAGDNEYGPPPADLGGTVTTTPPPVA